MDPVIINLALTGMVPTKRMSKHAPLAVKEIVQTALACAKLGASIIHIHPRNVFGKPTWEKQVFEEIIRGIKKKNKEVLISVTTSGRLWNEFEKRSACLDISGKLKPDLASLTVGSMNFIRQESINSPDMIEKLALKMKQRRIKPELEVFEPGMIHKAKYLMKKGVLSDKHPYFNILLGSLGTSPFETSTFSTMLALLPKNAVWSIAGIGGFQLDANVAGIAFGGHVRVGLEDNLYFDRKKNILASNQKLVKRIVSIIKQMDHDVATPAQTRRMLGI